MIRNCSVNGLHGLGITRVYLPDGSFRTVKAEKYDNCGEVLRFILDRTPLGQTTNFEDWSLMILTETGGESRGAGGQRC